MPCSMGHWGQGIHFGEGYPIAEDHVAVVGKDHMVLDIQDGMMGVQVDLMHRKRDLVFYC